MKFALMCHYLKIFKQRKNYVEIMKQTLQKDVKVIWKEPVKCNLEIGLFVGMSILHQMEPILKATN